MGIVKAELWYWLQDNSKSLKLIISLNKNAPPLPDKGNDKAINF